MRATTNQALAGGTIPYFKATNTVTEKVQVTLATMHLSEDAKLWQRSQYIDIHEGRYTIDTWDALKKELCSQFILENRKTVFCFVERLKPWAKTKLYEQRAQDLTSTYAAAKRLFDLTSDSQDVRRHESSSPGRNRNSHPSSLKAVRGDKCPNGDSRPFQPYTENTWRRPNNHNLPKLSLSCFICKGLHVAREWPNKTTFYAFQAFLTLDSDDKSSQVEGEVGQIEEGKNMRIEALKFLSSLQKKARETSVLVEKDLISQTSKTPLGEGLRKNEGFEFRSSIYRRTSEMDDDEVRRMKMPYRLSGYKNLIREEPTFVAILLEALGKSGETVPKDTLHVSQRSAMGEVFPEVRQTIGVLSRKNQRPPSEDFSETGGKPIGCQERKVLLGARTYKSTGSCGGVLLNWCGKKEDCRNVRLKNTKISHGVTLCPRLTNHNKQFVEGFLKRASLLTELLKEDI
ncbi:uncharacterized protein E5676_scaffold522G001010 [Cucumis melo var. makuwa]|uniref:Retrotransposon gag domain-containing protein n=1 Tax=Cucumis melo var. makuwa TaxID=1194695 RepID=A0A5A7UJC2_CUCMM|nr:uncharacterized protein E6C27_scaffold190G001520 [Cucumis melo var. makuwa]TYK19170.1 uncharacterized protein E5676_scaffold522G001010 [Cucumis melo var. makuwa]